MTKHAALLSSLLLACAAQAAEPPADPAVESIEISTTRDPEFKPYVRMLAGLDAFERLHAKAPAAPLRFLLLPQQPGLSPADVKLRIVGDAGSHDVATDAEGYFALPRVIDAVGGNAELVTNKKKGLYRWRADVRTPGVPAGMRRLGDLRLECEVRWAVTQDELGPGKRLLFKTLGGPCNSANVGVFNFAPQPVSTVTLTAGDRRVTMPAQRQIKGQPAGNNFYVVPLHDKSWPDDTLIAFDAQ